MSRSVGLAHVIRNPDRTATGIWSAFTLRSAFQPIFRFEGGKLRPAAFEGLARPFRDGEPVAPGVFLGLVPAADRFHVDTLLRALHLINAGVFLPADASIFINFDPSVLTERAIADAALREIKLVLHEAQVEPRRVVCEITEQRLSAESSLLRFIDGLKAHGMRVAVDDYGAADSDIARIRAVKPDVVKFDAKWITRLMESGPGFGLLSTLVENFSSQGVVTVFEGIEERWQLGLAERTGVSMVQGFALARPELVPPGFDSFQPTSSAPGSTDGSAPHGANAPHPAARPPRAFGRRSEAP